MDPGDPPGLGDFGPQTTGGRSPVTIPPPGTESQRKCFAPRPEADLHDFWLKRPTTDMLQAIAGRGACAAGRIGGVRCSLTQLNAPYGIN